MLQRGITSFTVGTITVSSLTRVHISQQRVMWCHNSGVTSWSGATVWGDVHRSFGRHLELVTCPVSLMWCKKVVCSTVPRSGVLKDFRRHTQYSCGETVLWPVVQQCGVISHSRPKKQHTILTSHMWCNSVVSCYTEASGNTFSTVVSQLSGLWCNSMV